VASPEPTDKPASYRPPHPDCRVLGAGRTMVLLHASVSSNRQWSAFQNHFGPQYRTLAPNLMGYGGARRATPGRAMTLDDQVDQIADLLVDPDNLAARAVLIGHSFGSAVAVKTALRYPERVDRLILIEPIAFGLLAAFGSYRFLAELHRIYAGILTAAAGDDWDGAAEQFSEYWSGPGSWSALDRMRQIAFTWGMPPVLHEWSAALRDADLFDGARRVSCPTLLLWAKDTVPVVHEFIGLIRQVAPDWQTAEIAYGGHMFPVTQPELALVPIQAFLKGG
jgi:pimeloyl-ACP methyl ester carboxylesterase